MKKYERSFEDLSKKEQDKLRIINKPNDIADVLILDTWTDDHILCVGLNLNGIKFAIWWAGWEIVAAIKYAMESNKAKTDLIKAIEWQIEMHDEDIGED